MAPSHAAGLQRWGPAKRATRATLLSALAGGQPHAQGAGDGGADARARGAKARSGSLASPA